MLRIRPAEPEDLHTCVYIAGVFHEGSQFSGVTNYRPEDAYEYAVYCQRDENKFFWVYEKDDEVVGFFIATRHTLPWNRRQWISEEELFFILPEHQSPRTAFRFFRAWESWAADLGTHHLLFNPTSFVDHNIDRWDSFCHAIGFQPGGKSYKKVLRHAD
jgi:GNAT superfamily N-acetyltransferase